MLHCPNDWNCDVILSGKNIKKKGKKKNSKDLHCQADWSRSGTFGSWTALSTPLSFNAFSRSWIPTLRPDGEVYMIKCDALWRAHLGGDDTYRKKRTGFVGVQRSALIAALLESTRYVRSNFWRKLIETKDH